jgi:hypothetical protein
LKFDLKEPMLVTARVESQNGIARELSSVFDFNSHYCTILVQDAIDMGYPEAANKHSEEERARPDRVFRFTTMPGIQRGIRVKLRKVSVGSLVARNVDAVALELEHPRFITYDFLLGRTFLKNFKMTVDFKNKFLSLNSK